METKDKIFVHIGPHLGMMQATTIPTNAPGEQAYIRKDGVVALLELEARRSFNITQRCAFETAIEIINSL